jgi:DNA repair exonuclease SbcCD ATPase subunit
MLVSRLNDESKIPSTRSNVEESMNPTPVLTSLSFASDTIPKSPRMKELELLIEEKAAELERLSDQLEREMEQNIEMDVEAMEELSDKLSSLHDQKIEGIESRYGAQMERLDGLSEQLEDRMKVFEKEMESLNEDLLRKLSEEMEMKSIELADHDSIPDDRRKQLQQEMQDLGRQMQEEMKSVHELQEQMMNNPELRQLRDEMSSLQEQLQPMHEEFRNIWTEEARALQERLHQMQDQLNVKMSGLHNELQEQIRVKSDEIRELQEEMHKELRKLHEKQ